MVCQGTLCVNTFAEYHLKSNFSYLQAFDLVVLNKVLYTFFPTKKTVQVMKAKAWYFHPQSLSVGEERDYGKYMGIHMYRVKWQSMLNPMRFSVHCSVDPVATSD